MGIREYALLLRRRWWLVAIGLVVGGLAAYAFSALQEPVYQATATLLISEGDIAQSNDFTSLQTSQRLAESYVERLKNREVLAAAITNLGLSMEPSVVENNMQVNLVGQTQLIELSVEHTSPRVAQALANEIPAVFAERNSEQQLQRYVESKASLQAELERLQEELDTAEENLAEAETNGEPAAEIEQLRNNVLQLRNTHSQLLQSYENVRIAEASSLNNIIVDEPARRPTNPIRPRILQNTILAIVVGGMFAAGIVFLLEYLDNTVKNPPEIEQLTGLSTIGTIGQMDAATLRQGLVVAHRPRAPIAEAYRQLRTNLMFCLAAGDRHSILVTSPRAAEGKTTTAANLAVALAQAANTVIIVDSDLRRPTIHRLFNVNNSEGLTNLLMENADRAPLLQETEVPGLRALTSGSLPPNPAELLGTQRMRQIAAWLADRADFVVYDSPPLLAVTDAAVLSQLADTILLVIRAGETTVPELAAALQQLLNVEAHIAGVVINRITPRNGYYYYNYYGDGYGYGHATGKGENGRGKERSAGSSRRP